jgi:Vitamin K-dependent gamma-carboxylase
MARWRERLRGFLFPLEADLWLVLLRIGLGLEVLFYTISLRADWNYLFAGPGEGSIGRALPEALLSTESPLVPRLGWLVMLATRTGFSESTALSIVWWVLLLVGGCLVIGIFSRASAILAGFVHLCAAESGGFISYGVDNFMTIGLFYLMLSPLPDRYSLDQLWRKLSPKGPQLMGFFRRVLQVHLCLIYFFGGLAKCLGGGWWDGSNLWRALIRPPFNVLAPEILIQLKYLFPVAGIAICLLEVSYPVFIWNRRTRGIWLMCICAMHVAIGLTMGMYLFASIMIVLNIAAFGPDLGGVGTKSFVEPFRETAS